jgi:Ice-binding-like/PEP-CTERM motif
MKRNLLVLATIVACAWIGTKTEAQSISLGVADSFAVLADDTVTNTGPTVLFGDLGLWDGTSITGFNPPGTVNGTIHLTDTIAMEAQAAALAAYNQLAGLAHTATLSGSLGGLTLLPGVYQIASAAQLTGTLTLNGNGLSDPLFVFQIGSTLTTASASSVVEINGANASNVYWQVGSSATLGTTSQFNGTLIANVSDTLTTGATVTNGHVFALTGAVTLDSNIIAVPEPATVALLFLGLALVVVKGSAIHRSRRGLA